MTKILIVTACGAKKATIALPAYKLYKSSRIRAVYRRRGNSDMCILSAEYGLIDAQEVISPYNRLMDQKRACELVNSIANKLIDYEFVLFFKGGARKIYSSCIEAACRKAGKTLVMFGYANMGGINDLPRILAALQENGIGILTETEHLKVNYPI